MPRTNAFDAGKRQQNASKAFPERQPTNPCARASSYVGCLLAGERLPEEQGIGALRADVEGGGGIEFVRDAPRHQQWRHSDRQAGTDLQAVHQRGVLAVLTPQLEGIDCGHFGADRKITSRFGVGEVAASCSAARGVAGPSRPQGVGSFVERSLPSAVVSKWNFQARPIRWAGAQQPGSRVEDSEKMSARTNNASADGRGGNEIHRGVRSQRETDFTACDLRGASSRRDSCSSVEGARKRCQSAWRRASTNGF